MTDVELREKIFRQLRANTEIRELMQKALRLEEEGRANNQYYLGWTWEDIALRPQRLQVLIEEQLIKVAYHSNSSKCYLVKDPDLIREALDTVSTVEEGEVAPGQLFSRIVGHDEVKYWLGKSLSARQPVHVLLIGPPASGKSLFLEELGTLPGAQYALGGSSTKAGIADFLINFKPRYLVVDELEKMDREDFSILLSLMASGVIARMKKGMRETERMAVTVYAGCNRTDHLPPELLSRFIQFRFETYTWQEFIDVAVSVITGELGKDAELARYIAEKVGIRTRDVRQAIQLAKLVDSKEEVDRFQSSDRRLL